jgi:hypothetical protein
MSFGAFLDPTFPASPIDLGLLGVTDEYIADLAATEFALIAPRDQDGASGSDGVFAAGNLFVLTSASAQFAAQGVVAGDLCAILDSKADSARVRGIYVATAVANGSLTLRTRGPRVGFGAPPGLLGGETNLRFRVPTARPQAALSAAKFRRRYRIAVPANVLNPYDFAPAVAYDVLVELYTLAARQASADAARDSLMAKAKLFAANRDEEIRILDASYKVVPDVMPLVVGRMRLPSLTSTIVPPYQIPSGEIV